MSNNYAIEEYPQGKYRFRLFDNVDKLDVPQIVARNPGCVGAINLAYFALTSDAKKGIKYFDHQSAVMFAGKWGCQPEWHEFGICIDRDGVLTLGTEKEAVHDYAVALPPAVIDGKNYNTTAYGRNGVSYTGLKADGTVVFLLAMKDAGMTSAEAVSIMRKLGCIHIFRWDGSWSSRGYINGKYIKPSQYRCDRTWLLVFERKTGENKPPEEEPMKHTVCLDPGHGVESPGKCSPDKTYYERDFALDMGQRVRDHLERCGVAVVLTRDNEHCPTGKADATDLLHRAAISNQAGADLFVSLHSNASGDAWSTAKGLMIYTSAGPMTAARNVAATKLLARMHEAGVTVRSTPVVHDIELVVTRQTNAPAVLIEYGFHTNKDEVALLKSGKYRAKLAEATAKGIGDFLGAAWTPELVQDRPWYLEAQAWAVALDVADGEYPDEAATRAEVWTMLKRVYEAIKAGK